tara:strand:+ start:294 stop:1499 length:1206 start_codon:yes stop_codon:yes gene_type:complete
MSYKEHPRVVTDEQFSDGTTIDGNRLDGAVQDIQDRFNKIPYGDLKSRWVPITYMCGWQPQSRKTIYYDTSADLGEGFVSQSEFAAGGGVVPEIHRFPWMVMTNNRLSVPRGESGFQPDDDLIFTNPFRVKGVQPRGMKSRGVQQLSLSGGAVFMEALTQFGEQWCWSRSWFLDRPNILDSIDLVMLIDHPSMSTPSHPARTFDNSLKYSETSTSEIQEHLPGLPPNDLFDRGMVICATVDSIFDQENQTSSAVEVLRRDFRVIDDSVTVLATNQKGNGVSGQYQDMRPYAGDYQPETSPPAGMTGGGTIWGVSINLNNLNIPLHQNSRLRIHTLIPRYVTPAGRNPSTGVIMPVGPTDNQYTYLNNFTVDQSTVNGWGYYPWFMQQMNMTVTMLEEVTDG